MAIRVHGLTTFVNRRALTPQITPLIVAGEMIDWEAPTGGYLMQDCYATATRAATSAVGWLSR